jgi:transcriptional regulator with XRE-family HTH domain
MELSKKVKILLVTRDMNMTDLAEKLGTTVQNLSNKLRRGNLSEKDLHEIAEACDATFESGFKLKDTGEEI